VIAYASEPMILRYSSSENAFSVLVRTLPPPATQRMNFATDSSFGASMWATMSKSPIVM
jgi:hypothetical protein